jgi:glucan phosphoethanolaminetransferase (alkaline phosphatase superfamily)
MSEPGAVPWRRSFAFECLAWAGLASAFLTIYVIHFEAAWTVVPGHLLRLFAFWLGTVGLRLLVRACLPQARVAGLLTLALALSAWLLVAAWYAAMLVGLMSWGRVTTWPLIRTYAGQYGYLAESLALPGWLPWMLPVAFALLLVLLDRLPGLRPGWTQLLRQKSSGTAPALLLACLLLAIPSAVWVKDRQVGAAHPQEPLQLSFFPEHGQQRQSHIYGESPKLDAEEALARRQYPAPAGIKRRNVILIVGDALRADHMGFGGYAKPTTPYLDQLSRDARATVVPMRSVCAESTCGLMALASSRPIHLMPAAPLSLHEVLRGQGYQVRFVLGGDHTNFYGLREMYGKADSYFDGSTQTGGYMNDDQIVVDHIATLPDNDPARATLLQVHLMSTHGLGSRHAENTRFTPVINYYLWPQGHRIAKTAAEREAAIHYYDNGMVQFDRTVEQILRQLGAKGYLQDAVVVITGDHGEMLGEHELFGHRQRVFEAALDVPFLMLRYGYQAAPLPPRRLASQVDIAPTLLAELGLPAPATWRGVALQQPPAAAREIYFQQSRLAGLYDLRADGQVLKFWRDFASGREYAYDVVTDPLERNNRVGSLEVARRDRYRARVSQGGLVSEARLDP